MEAVPLHYNRRCGGEHVSALESCLLVRLQTLPRDSILRRLYSKGDRRAKKRAKKSLISSIGNVLKLAMLC